MAKKINKLVKKSKKIDWKLLVLSVLISFFVAYIGSSFTVIDSWYESVKPSITPPSIVFPIVWTILFFLIGLAFYFSKVFDGKKSYKMGLLYLINFILNVSWSFFFFTMHNPLYSLVVIFLLILSIISLILFNWKNTRISSYLLIPYLVWVCFASILNILIVIKMM